jgi:hypothetical protein
VRFWGQLFHASPNRKDGAAEHGASLAVCPAPDLVDGINALAEYYRFLEAQAYDRGFKSVRERRDFRDEFLHRIDALLVYETDANATAQIQLEIDKEASFSTSGHLDTFDPAEDAQCLDPRGFDLLSPPLPLTYDSLRTAYRAAAKMHHPDVGGDNVTMQRINDAYALFSALVRRSTAQAGTRETIEWPELRPITDFFCDVRFTKLAALVDDFASDAAFDTFGTITAQQYVGRYDAVHTLARLAEILASSSRGEQAQEVLHILHEITDTLDSRGMNFGPIYASAVRTVESPKERRFVFNHTRQTNNALRLGIIDAKQRDVAAARIAKAEEKLSDEADLFETFVHGAHLLRLPMDISAEGVVSKGLIPGPDYYSRVETMSALQRDEYMRAFHGIAPQLAAKYAAVRIDALLRSAFLGFEGTDALISELREFSKAPGLKLGVRNLCGPALEILEFLKGLGPPEQAQRIRMLRDADSDPRQMAAVMTLDASGVHVSQPRPIMANPSYMQFATGPIERIERFLTTGSEETSEETARRVIAQREEFEAMRAFNSSEVYEAAKSAIWAEQKDPILIATTSAALCEAMYVRIGAKGDRWMDIGYWTNQLTINLMKLKRYNEVIEWINRVNTVPDPIKERMPRSTLDSMDKRRSRAESLRNSEQSVEYRSHHQRPEV